MQPTMTRSQEKQRKKYLLEIAGGTRGDLGVPENDLLSSAAAEGSHDAGENLLLADEGGVLARHEPGQAAGLASGDERHLLHWVMACSHDML